MKPKTKLTTFEKIAIGVVIFTFLYFVVFQFILRFHGIIVVDPYLNLL